MPVRPIGHHTGIGAAFPLRINLSWKGDISGWKTMSPAVPIHQVIAAATELLTRRDGTAFLLPSLSKACGSQLLPQQVDPNITVEKYQEGADAGIFKVTAQVRFDGQQRSVSFCLNIAKTADKNQLHRDIARNLSAVRKIDPSYAVRPFFLAEAEIAGENLKLAGLSTEWLEGYVEVDAINMAEGFGEIETDFGLAATGMRKFLLNDRGASTFFSAIIEDPALTDAIAEEMVKILTIYFHPATSYQIQLWGVSNGDFVYRPNPEGGVSLKLVTVRQYGAHPVVAKHPSLNVFSFILELLRHRETSVTHQNPEDPLSASLSIYPFTPTDICRGIKKGLVALHGEERARELSLKWLTTFAGCSSMLFSPMDLDQKDLAFRIMLMQQEIGRFLFEEEKHPRGITVEL